MTSSAVNNNAI